MLTYKHVCQATRDVSSEVTMGLDRLGDGLSRTDLDFHANCCYAEYQSTDLRRLSRVWIKDKNIIRFIRRITAHARKYPETCQTTNYLLVTCFHRMDCMLHSLNSNYCNASYTHQLPYLQA